MSEWATFSLVTIGLWGVMGLLQKLSTNRISADAVFIWSRIGYLPVLLWFLTMTSFHHLTSLARSDPLAPSPGEFGAGLLIAESYAMAVEMLAAVECILAGEGQAVGQLGAGLIERATRLPGGAHPAAEFAHLPTLAEVYLLGPLEVLTGGAAADALPGEIAGALSDRWHAACSAYPPAATFGSAATELITRHRSIGLLTVSTRNFTGINSA